MSAALLVEDLNVFYGGAHILKGVSLGMQAGEVLALLGRNGAGKTTTLRAIMGLTRSRSGRVRLNGKDLTMLVAHEVSRQGIAYVPQGRRLFPFLTVAENLKMGLLVRNGGGEVLAEVLDEFPRLKERLGQRAGSLSGGEQQMLATARALCARPTFLLMDEPTEGLMPAVERLLMDIVRALKSRGVGILLVEQKIDAALKLADQVALLDNGVVRHRAAPDELARDPEVLLRYLGVRR